jgi:hypothetical protein
LQNSDADLRTRLQRATEECVQMHTELVVLQKERERSHIEREELERQLLAAEELQ